MTPTCEDVYCSSAAYELSVLLCCDVSQLGERLQCIWANQGPRVTLCFTIAACTV